MTLVHILRTQPTTTEREKKQLSSLDKYQRRYLSRWGCGLCHHSLNQSGCGAFFGEACDERMRIKRRANCLKEYKPRPNRRKQA